MLHQFLVLGGGQRAKQGADLLVGGLVEGREDGQSFGRQGQQR
nr:hypothetical protein [Tanacetum cinerariifolium]